MNLNLHFIFLIQFHNINKFGRPTVGHLPAFEGITYGKLHRTAQLPLLPPFTTHVPIMKSIKAWAFCVDINATHTLKWMRPLASIQRSDPCVHSTVEVHATPCFRFINILFFWLSILAAFLWRYSGSQRRCLYGWTGGDIPASSRLLISGVDA